MVMETLAFIAFLALVGALAAVWGIDSRTSDEPRSARVGR